MALVDPNVPAQDSDKQLIEWLQHAQRPYLVVATKADKLSGNQLTNSLRKLGEELGTQRILPFSARTNKGYDELWKEIWEAKENLAGS